MSKLRRDRRAWAQARFHRRAMKLARTDQMTGGIYAGYCWLMNRKVHAPGDPVRHDYQFMQVDAWFYPRDYNN